MRPKQRAALRKLFSLPPIPNPPPSDKILLRPWKKKLWSYTETYRHFKVLQKYCSLASRNSATQMFFLTPNRNMFVGKFVKSERFLVVLQEHINVK